MSEYNLLVAGGTTYLSQRLEQQIAYTRAEIRHGQENIGWMSDISKKLESETDTIRKTLQMDPASFVLDDIKDTSKIASFATTIDPQKQAERLHDQIKVVIDSADKALNIVAEDVKQSNNSRWFQNHTPNRWPIPDPDLFERPGKPGKRSLDPGFGNRINPISFMAEFHPGVDVDGDFGEPVYAVAEGVVTISKWHGGYGQLIEIKHRSDSGGIYTRYAHNQELLVKEGDKVLRGQKIALMGSTGYSTGPHIHFELIVGKEFVDPGQYIRTQIQNGIKGDDLTVPKDDDKNSKNNVQNIDKNDGEKDR
jgi:murein DD-endopeptidase MepM/ murein hydrolase activator NlpD